MAAPYYCGRTLVSHDCNGGVPLSVPHPRIASYHLPTGTNIGTCAPTINRNRDVFGEDADVFRPERWAKNESLGREEDERLRIMEQTFFSVGIPVDKFYTYI
jgi:hypothetical protein